MSIADAPEALIHRRQDQPKDACHDTASREDMLDMPYSIETFQTSYPTIHQPSAGLEGTECAGHTGRASQLHLTRWATWEDKI